MNILVTGGAGFIGSHVCQRLLSAGHAVWALDDLNGFYDPALKRQNLAEIQALEKPFVFAQGDVTDRPLIDRLLHEVKFDQIIHLAARPPDIPAATTCAAWRDSHLNVKAFRRGAGTREVRRVDTPGT